MKKIKFSLLILLTLILVTGCGTKELTCSVTDEDWGIDINADFEFNNDTLTKFTTIAKTDLSSWGLEMTDEEVDEQCEDYKDIDGIVCDAKLDGETSIVTIKYTVKNLPEEVLNEIGIEDLSYDSVKDSFENEEYTCE